MNKTKQLREQVKKDLDIFIDSVVEEAHTDEVFITEGYWFYDDLLNFAEKLLAQNRKAILEEVRSALPKEIENRYGMISPDVGYNQAIKEIRQKLSLLEGKTK